MFAVKGWSVSADKLKSEVASAPPADAAAAAAPSKKSKKRKRQAEDVTSSNVVDLWEKVIEHKEPQPKDGKSQPKDQTKSKKARKDKKQQKLSPDHAAPETTAESGKAAPASDGPDQGTSPSKKDKKDKKERKDRKKDRKDKTKAASNDDSANNDAATAKKPSAKALVPSAPPAPAKLTPLQASMREKLISARFRHLNETLYTRPSADALSLFAESPEMFTEYHEGFRRQVEVWPENPVEGYLADIRARARARHPPRDHRNKKAQAPAQGPPGQQAAPEVQPLPRNRTTNLCTIADLGCGDARLAAELQADKAKLRVDVLSFDLHSPSPLVTRADVANLPLANGTVDVAIFCLALMGTNWVDFVEEAYRVLRWKGELWVAEIKSRFAAPAGGGGKGGKVVEHSVGHRRKPGAAGAGKKSGGGKETDETTLLVEVDGVDDTRQQTDVSAFVDVLNKRGFMLVGQDQGQGADAIDLSNKMFVKMRFIKSAPAVKGKCVRKEEAEEQRSRLGGKMQVMAKKPKFIDAGEEVNESSVLKPCVYKIR